MKPEEASEEECDVAAKAAVEPKASAATKPPPTTATRPRVTVFGVRFCVVEFLRMKK
jgi:hypothetical protein